MNDRKSCDSGRRRPLSIRKQDADEGNGDIDACGRQTRSFRIGSSEVKFDDEYKFFGHYTYRSSIVFEILMAVTIAVQFYLYTKYLDDPQAQGMLPFNLLNIYFCIIGKYIWDGFRAVTDAFELRGIQGRNRNILSSRCGIRIGQKYTERDTIGGPDIVLAILLWALIVVTQQLRFVELNVSPIDAFLFYTFAAPAEEAFFRYFLTVVFIIGISKALQIITKNEKITANKFVEIAIKASVGFLTGILFGLAHAERYAGGDLFVITLNGIQFSLMYAFIRRIDVVLLAHLFLNMQFGIRFLQS